MGNRSSGGRTLSDADIRLFSQQTQLQPHIIQQLYEAFCERAGRDGRMNVEEFKRCYAELNPRAHAFTLEGDAERAFMLFDTDRNGVLTFDEFMMAYVLLQRGIDPAPNRWLYVINSMPGGVFSRPGYLNSAEALALLQHMNRFYQLPNFDPAAQHNLIWGQVATQLDPTGYIPQAEFLRIVSAQPHLQPHIW